MEGGKMQNLRLIQHPHHPSVTLYLSLQERDVALFSQALAEECGGRGTQ